jgi:glutathione S-transferase
MGQEISLVDITFCPMLERAAASLAYYKGFVMRGSGKFPALEAWFDAMESRPTYLGTKSDHYTHVSANLALTLLDCVAALAGCCVWRVVWMLLHHESCVVCARWCDAMESRPTYLGTNSDHSTHVSWRWVAAR